MAPIVRTATIKATSSTIWKTCFAHMKWEIWDPRIEKVIDTDGTLADKSTCTFLMKNEKKIVIKILISENKIIEYEGKMALGKFVGTILMSDKKDSTTEMEYSFLFEGCFGSLAQRVGGSVEDMERGLENIINLSEEAQMSLN